MTALRQMILARVHITLKNGILDPRGKTVKRALGNLGVAPIDDVRVGKLIELRFGEVSLAEAKGLTEEACKRLLANPVIEEYEIEILENGAVK